MIPLKKWAIFILVSILSFASLTPEISAQIFEIHQHHGKQITCMRSGLMGFAMECGLEADYEYVFEGLVLSVAEISETEMRLQLKPEEVFLGTPTGELTVTTIQGACFPDIHVNDKWLFYLRRDEKSHALLLIYGSPSAPAKEAQKEIALLRQLMPMTNAGIVKGNVTRVVREATMDDNVPVPGHKIIAKRLADGIRYTTSANKNGEFDFEPLPIGSYELTANTVRGLWAESGTIDVSPRSCSNVWFDLTPDGRIAGHLRVANGKPIKNGQIVVVPESNPDGEFTSEFTDDQGYYEFHGLWPGRYLIGLDFHPDSESSPDVYYPGVKSRDKAVVIDLGQAEQRLNIDFQLRHSDMH